MKPRQGGTNVWETEPFVIIAIWIPLLQLWSGMTNYFDSNVDKEGEDFGKGNQISVIKM